MAPSREPLRPKGNRPIRIRAAQPDESDDSFEIEVSSGSEAETVPLVKGRRATKVSTPALKKTPTKQGSFELSKSRLKKSPKNQDLGHHPPESTPKAANKGNPPRQTTLEEAFQPLRSDPEIEACISACTFFRSRLLEPHSAPASSMILRPHLKQAQQDLQTLLVDAVQKPGASTSCLLIGARGVGKTLVAEQVLVELNSKFNTTGGAPLVGIVRLSGLVHAEERMAYREIARQLCETFNCPFTKSASLEENLAFLRAMLKELRSAHKLIVFLLDEFDLFARKAKQLVLYNLFDALQASDMQAAVVGISTRVDVLEMLEKRVRSRFSYRRCFIHECEEATHPTVNGNSASSVLQEMLKLPDGIVGDQYTARWNAALADCLDTPEIRLAIAALHWKGLATPRCMAHAANYAVCKSAASQHAVLSSVILQEGLLSLQSAWDSHGQMIPSLSILELFIIAAIQRLKRQQQHEVNFTMVWKEYCKLKECSREGHVDSQYNRSAASRAFERLLQLGLIAYSRPRVHHQGMLRDFEPVWLTFANDELQQGVEKHNSRPPFLMTWLHTELAVTA